MNMRGMRFEVDRSEGKLLGVCAGLSRRTGLDVTVIRVGVVLTALLASFWAVAIFYLAAAFAGSQGRRFVRSRREAQSDDVHERIRSHDLRMRSIETYVSGSNSRLAREIEELR
jgi:phage shock protein C